jgi:RNA polymerase sigma factor (sigma-70 family)
MSPSDHELIESCLRGEQSGWTQLVSRYQRLIYSVARALCPEREDCADVFQYVCMELYQSLPKLRNEKTLPAWLITVARRQSYSLIRAKKPHIPIGAYNNAASDGRIEAIEKEAEMEWAVAQLPERCQELLRLLYFDSNEPTYADIARRMGMPESSIGPTRARCLGKLKKLLSHE